MKPIKEGLHYIILAILIYFLMSPIFSYVNLYLNFLPEQINWIISILIVLIPVDLLLHKYYLKER